MADIRAFNKGFLVYGHAHEITDIKIDKKINQESANGMLFIATDELDRELVVKIWIQSPSDPRSKEDKAKCEAKKLSDLDHENIINVFRFGNIGGFPFTVMPLIKGKTLKEWLADAPSLQDRLKVWGQIFDGLKHSYENDIFHGDLHNKNILVDQNNKVKIIDFGTSVFFGREHAAIRDLRGLFKILSKIIPPKFEKLSHFRQANKITKPAIMLQACNNIMNMVVLLSDYREEWSLHEKHGEWGWDYRNFAVQISSIFCSCPLIEQTCVNDYLISTGVPEYHVNDIFDFCMQRFIGEIRQDESFLTIFRHGVKVDMNSFNKYHEQYIDMYLEQNDLK